MRSHTTLINSAKKPGVSVVIPVYNGEKYIASAIDSVLGQDYSNVEIIVLDDGSTDGTRDVLARYNDRIFWETHSNMGQASTLNKGWAMSSGSILSYLSADDLLMPNAVSEGILALGSHPDAVMAYGSFDLIDPNSAFIRHVHPGGFNYKDMVVNIVCPPGPGVFFKREAYEVTGGWNGAYRQMPDYDFWLRLGLQGDFIHILKSLAAFRVHDDSQSFAKGDDRKSNEPIAIISALFDNGSDLPATVRECQWEALANAHLVSAQLHWRSDRYLESGRKVIAALRIFPWVMFKKRTLKLVLNAFVNRLGHRLLWQLRKRPAH